MTQGKIIGIIVIVILLILLLIWWYRKPKISIIPNWDNKTFTYKLSVNGCHFEGQRSMIDNRPILDQTAETKTCGKYFFEVHKDSAFIWQGANGNALKAVSIDIPSKTISETQAFR